jgi:hypothetical protein
MDEDLENQLKALEIQEQEQYKLMEQVIEEQLEQEEHQNNTRDNLEGTPIEQIMLMQELETIIEEEEEGNKADENDLLFKKNKTWKRHEQRFNLEQLKKYQQQQFNKVHL